MSELFFKEEVYRMVGACFEVGSFAFQSIVNSEYRKNSSKIILTMIYQNEKLYI